MREAPSGSGTITDEQNVVISIADDDAAGAYYVGFEANIGSAIILVSDPTATIASVFNGVQTRAGRIGRARVIFGAETGGDPPGVRKDTILQWAVIDQASGVATLVGKQVVVPWQQFVSSISANIADFGNLAVDFGSVPWKAGQLYVLQMTIGAIVSGTPGQGLIQMTFERIYNPVAPVIGPSEGP